MLHSSQSAPLTSALQFDLFSEVLGVYANTGGELLANQDLYHQLALRSDCAAAGFAVREPIGVDSVMHSPLKRQVRWYQQTLKALGLLERDDQVGPRGHWRLTAKGQGKIGKPDKTAKGEGKLTPAAGSAALLGFSTALGVALWSRAESAFPLLGEPIHLCLSSLPYPLAVPREYGNPKEQEYVDWVCKLLEPIVAQLAKGGSVVLNVGNDVFLKGSPARSLYKERMVIALSERFALSLMDQLIWQNPSRPPGPVRYASVSRQQLNACYEPFYWFTNDPLSCRSNNRRVLQPHSEQHLKLLAQGGEKRDTLGASYGDGAHRVRPGSYANATPGKIARNVISMGHRCGDKIGLAKLARAAGLPVHGATMPLKLAKFMIEFLSEKNDLVVDPCAGWFRTAKAAEQTGRRWFATEQMGEYVLGGALGMQQSEGFECFGTLVPSDTAVFDTVAQARDPLRTAPPMQELCAWGSQA